MEPAADRPARTGRPPSTSADRLQEIALDLFIRNGFDETTIDDVATAAGIGRRTFFRYYASKNDLVWGDFEARLEDFRRELAALDDVPMLDALRRAVVAFNAVDASAAEQHRHRMQLILTVPALQAHSTLRYAAWRHVVQDFVARRTATPADAYLPRLLGYLALAASVAAYEQWLTESRPGGPSTTLLAALIDDAFARLPDGFAHLEPPRP